VARITWPSNLCRQQGIRSPTLNSRLNRRGCSRVGAVAYCRSDITRRLAQNLITGQPLRGILSTDGVLEPTPNSCPTQASAMSLRPFQRVLYPIRVLSAFLKEKTDHLILDQNTQMED